MTDYESYFAEVAETELAKAEALAKQGRRAGAQHALREAKYWAIKCPAESILNLGDRITILENKLY